jgi:hypothetical protein
MKWGHIHHPKQQTLSALNRPLTLDTDMFLHKTFSIDSRLDFVAQTTILLS